MIESLIVEKICLYKENSLDPKRKVGCCIVKNNDIISFGCNNPPKKFDKHMTWNTNEQLDNKFLYVVHAEADAIISSKQCLNGCVLYTTLFPCNECAKLIIQSEISEVVYLEKPSVKLNEYIASEHMLKICGVKLRRFSFDN